MKSNSAYALISLLAAAVAASAADSPASHLKEETRAPWTRSNERFIRHWLVLSDIPSTAASEFEKDWLGEQGGETAIRPVEKMTHRLPDGKTFNGAR